MQIYAYYKGYSEDRNLEERAAKAFENWCQKKKTDGYLESYKPREARTSPSITFVKDALCGNVALTPAMRSVIDTPEFQRLRHIKMTSAFYVYPGAVHTQFSHAIGCAFLAKQFADTLLDNDEAQKLLFPPVVSEKDRALCTKRLKEAIQIAALVHELGRGPYTEVFETFLKHHNKLLNRDPANVDYRFRSVMMLDQMYERCKVPFHETFGDDMGEWKSLIEAIINPPKPDKLDELTFPTGIDERWQFLFEIVTPMTTGLDCCSWDTFQRNSRFLGIHTGIDVRRFMNNCRLNRYKGSIHVTLNEKVGALVSRTIFAV